MDAADASLIADRACALGAAIHEVADIAVNFGGYADDADVSNARADKRDRIEIALRSVVDNASKDLDAMLRPCPTKDGTCEGIAGCLCRPCE